VKAWGHIVNARPNARLLLVGPRRDKYREVEDRQFLEMIDGYVHGHGLGETMVEVGFTDKVERYLQVADAFLTTSRREGCPNAVLEAMATGTPVVASRISNTTDDLITDGVDGFITNPDAGVFADAVTVLLTSPELRRRVGETARQTVLDRHDIDRVAGRYLDILETCH
jgi:glycosyltransferase involved in cell wall biosynthesis